MNKTARNKRKTDAETLEMQHPQPRPETQRPAKARTTRMSTGPTRLPQTNNAQTARTPLQIPSDDDDLEYISTTELLPSTRSSRPDPLAQLPASPDVEWISTVITNNHDIAARALQLQAANNMDQRQLGMFSSISNGNYHTKNAK